MGDETKLGIATIPIRATMDELDRDLTTARRKMETASTGMQSIIGTAGKVAIAGAVGGIAAVTGAVVGLGAAAMSVGMEFDNAFDILATKTGATGGALDALKDDFRAVFSEIPTDAESAASVIATLNQRLQLTGQLAQEGGKAVLEASRLMGEDAVQNTELLTRVMGDWDLEGKNIGSTMDKVFAASQATGIGMGELMQKVVQFGAPMRLMGFSLSDSVAMLGKWEKEGVNTELVMGSLRIAAGNFADSMNSGGVDIGETTEKIDKHRDKLSKLQDQLAVARGKQSEFNDKTKESTKLQAQLKIEQITKDIKEEEAAINNLSQTLNQKATPSTKSLREQLMGTFETIKSAASETDALSVGMEVFGARAGPDMVAAIREGRFAIGDLEKALEQSEGAIEQTARGTEDFPEKLQILRNQAKVAIAPLGDLFMTVANTVVDSFMPAVQGALQSAGGIFQGFSDRARAALSEVSGNIGVFKTTLETKGVAGVLTDVLEPRWSDWTADIRQNIDDTREFSESGEVQESARAIGLNIGRRIAETAKQLLGGHSEDGSLWSHTALDDLLGSMLDWVSEKLKALGKIGSEITIGIVEGIFEQMGKPLSGEQKSALTENMKALFGALDFVSVAQFLWGKLIGVLSASASAGYNLGTSLRGYAEGGMVPGPIGQPQLAVVHGGEMVIPAGDVMELTTNHFYNLTTQSNVPSQGVANDFYVMRALARG